jgi:hypothetical protein
MLILLYYKYTNLVSSIQRNNHILNRVLSSRIILYFLNHGGITLAMSKQVGMGVKILDVYKENVNQLNYNGRI